MVAAASIKIEKIAVSKLLNMSLDNLPFGRYFTDHMLEADYVDGKWTNIAIRPYQPISFEPSLSAIHYGQSILKALKPINQKQETPIFFALTII